MRASKIAIAAALLLAACTPQNGDTVNSAPSPDRAGDSATVRGTVAVVGSAPVGSAVVVQGGNGNTLIEGPLAQEIGRLSGAEVEVTGARRSDPMYREAVAATGYTVRSVDGRPVVMGVVEQAQGGQLRLRTDDGRVIQLAGGAGTLRAGQKVWVQGQEAIQVQSFGVIRP